MELTMIEIMQALRRAIRLPLIAVALFGFTAAAQAQHKPSAAALATAHQLINITGATTLFRPLIAGVIEQAKTPFLQQNPALAGELKQIAAKINAEMEPRFSELTNEVATLYATHFTEPELKAILAFYQSPAGKKMLAVQPRIIDASMNFAQNWANKLSDEVVSKMREELKKRGHPM
jgi:uncharacterized protein